VLPSQTNDIRIIVILITIILIYLNGKRFALIFVSKKDKETCYAQKF